MSDGRTCFKSSNYNIIAILFKYTAVEPSPRGELKDSMQPMQEQNYISDGWCQTWYFLGITPRTSVESCEYLVMHLEIV